MNTSLMERNNKEGNFLEESRKKTYYSNKLDTIENKKEFFNALENADMLLNDCVNKEISIRDFYVEEYEKEDENTGEVLTKYRTIIFDLDGKTYATGSYGIFNSIKKLLMVYGEPTYDEGVKVKIVKKKTRSNKQSLSLELL